MTPRRGWKRRVNWEWLLAIALLKKYDILLYFDFSTAWHGQIDIDTFLYISDFNINSWLFEKQYARKFWRAIFSENSWSGIIIPSNLGSPEESFLPPFCTHSPITSWFTSSRFRAWNIAHQHKNSIYSNEILEKLNPSTNTSSFSSSGWYSHWWRSFSPMKLWNILLIAIHQTFSARLQKKISTRHPTDSPRVHQGSLYR